MLKSHKEIYDVLLKKDDIDGDIWMAIECCLNHKSYDHGKLLIGQSEAQKFGQIFTEGFTSEEERQKTLEEAKRKLKKLDIVGAGTQFIFGPLKKLNDQLTTEEENILKFGKSKASTVKKVSVIIRIILIQAIRQGSIAIDDIIIPFSKILIKALASAAAWTALTTVVGAIGGAGFGSIPGFIGGIGSAFVAGLPLTLITTLPVLIKGSIKLIKEIFRKGNPLRGVPLIIPIIPIVGLDPGSLTLAALGGLPLIIAVAGPLLIKLFVNYIKSRRKNKTPSPKNNQDVKAELIAAIAEVPVDTVPKSQLAVTKIKDTQQIGGKITTNDSYSERLVELYNEKKHGKLIKTEYKNPTGVVSINTEDKSLHSYTLFEYGDKGAKYQRMENGKNVMTGFTKHDNTTLLENIDKSHELVKKLTPFHLGIVLAGEYGVKGSALSITKMIMDVVSELS